MTPRITVTPERPEPGKDMVICYDFDGLEFVSVTLDIDWTPSSCTPTSVTVSVASGACTTITTCEDGVSCTISDPTGNSFPFPVVINN